jgi:hypothetical protein
LRRIGVETRLKGYKYFEISANQNALLVLARKLNFKSPPTTQSL